MSERELHTMAGDIVRGAWYLPLTEEELKLGMSFLGMAGAFSHLLASSVGTVLGDMSATTKTGFNGVPMFLACRPVHVADTPALCAKVRELDALLRPAQAEST